MDGLPSRFSTSPTDPLFHIISSNDLPTAEELSLATSRIDEVTQQLKPIQTDIRALAVRLVSLHARERSLASKRNKDSEIVQDLVQLDSHVVQEHALPGPVSSSPPSVLAINCASASHQGEEMLATLRGNTAPFKEDTSIQSVDKVDAQLSALRAKKGALEKQLAAFNEEEKLLLRRKLESLPRTEQPSGSPPPIYSLSSSAMTSETPTSPSMERLRATVDKMTKLDLEMRPLQDEIVVVLSQLTSLQSQEQTFLLRKNEHTPILSPCRALPSEVISEIMQEAVNPVSPSFLSDTNTSTNRHHFKNLRSVCRLWREVAFGTYSLWTSVWVDFDQYSEEAHLALIGSIEHYFRHSGPTLRLNVGFNWRRNPAVDSPKPGDVGQAFNAWLGYLFSQRARWEEITFFSQAYHFQLFEVKLRQDLELGNGAWKTMFLQVSTHCNSLAETPDVPSVALERNPLHECFPTLETINLSSEDDILPAEGPLILLNGHPNLRKLRLDIYRDMNYYFSRLGGLRNLKKLLINCPKLNIIPPLAESPIYEFPSLELLVVSCMPSFTFLSKLRTPSLSTLQILTNIPPSLNPASTASLQNDLWTTFDEVIAFIGQCGQNLREFHLNCWFMKGDDHLRRLLEALTPIERLCIDTWFMNRGGSENQSLDVLQNSTYLPSLNKFCIHPIDNKTEQLLESVLTHQTPATNTGRYGDDLESESQSEGSVHASEAPPVYNGGAETGEWDPTVPFARPQFSWPSFGAFLESTKKRRNEAIPTLGAGGSSRSGRKPKFAVCIPDDVCEVVGHEARSIVQLLAHDETVNVEGNATCKIFW